MNGGREGGLEGWMDEGRKGTECKRTKKESIKTHCSKLKETFCSLSQTEHLFLSAPIDLS